MSAIARRPVSTSARPWSSRWWPSFTPCSGEHAAHPSGENRMSAWYSNQARVAVLAVCVTAACAYAPARAAADAADIASLAATPQMGFNNWNSTHCRAEFNEAMIRGIADKFIELGLKDAGYRYINIDDCWAYWQRDKDGNLKA